MANRLGLGLAIGGVVGGLLALLLIILLPMSFSYLDYDEYGFARRRTTGTVDVTKVYSGGRHLIGPDYEFKIFQATGHPVNAQHISIFTKDNLEVKISVILWYFLIKEDLPLLHKSFGINYETAIENNVKDALKNSVTKFDTDEFITNRSVIQKDLYYGARQRLSGVCCLPKCKKNCDTCREWEKCDPNCKPREQCNEADKGLFVEVRYLQLHDIDIPVSINERKLLSLIRDLEKEKEESVKEESIVRKQTEYEIAKIKNNATETLARANSEAKFKISEANIKYEQTIESTHYNGMKKIIDDLGITSAKNKASLNYLRVLRDHEKVKYSIDFNTLVTNTN